ncbi:MAG: SUMF1/EgtB/PvdO family nonheme iron enzyme, partial [Myxococcales bacterium]|nr:SUMF1/EgtB/PvdO family nonheme iron enzyme [Myxococcales bacterium]
HVPRAGSAHPDERGPMAYGRGSDGHFHLTVDAEGDLWQPDWPVMLVRWFDAVAYARWLAETTELPWRLPQELEWEKAARGVDRRIFPWGNYCDPTWCCMLESHPQRPMIASVDAFEHDESPYGVRGMAGNVRDWCLDRYQAGRPPTSPCVGPPDTSPGLESDPRIIRGGYFGASEPGVHC